MCLPGGPVLSEAKRDQARHAQRAKCSGGLQGGLGAQPPAGSRGVAPAGVRGAVRGAEAISAIQKDKKQKNGSTRNPINLTKF